MYKTLHVRSLITTHLYIKKTFNKGRRTKKSLIKLSCFFFQYYFYEYAEEGDDLHVKRPRQCLPYALLTFTMVDSSAPPQEPSVLQVSCQCSQDSH